MNGLSLARGGSYGWIGSLVVLSLSTVASAADAPPIGGPQVDASKVMDAPSAQVAASVSAAASAPAPGNPAPAAPPPPPVGPPAPGAYESSSTVVHMFNDDAEKEPESGMAVMVSLSPLAFGPEGLLSGRAEGIPMGASVQLEFQPYFLRYFGTAGIGPVFSTFPFYSEQGKDPGVQSAWSAGVEGRYQFKIAPMQFLVPSFGYQYSRLHYTLTGGQQSTTNLQGPVFGLELVLSALGSSSEVSPSDEARSPSVYVTIEVRDLKGGDDTVTVSSPGWYFGLGIEL